MNLLAVRVGLSLWLLATGAMHSAIASCDEPRLVQAIEAELTQWQNTSRHRRNTSHARDLSAALARLGQTERALEVAQITANRYNSDEIDQSRDEVLRLATRRLARRGAASWGLKTALRIRHTMSRLDALLAVARLNLRRDEKQAASKVMRLATPMFFQSERSNVMAYGAWMLTRVGDTRGAQRLFLQAQKLAADDMGERLEDRASAVAYYQAKAGWYDEAAATAGNRFWAISGVVRVLEERREFERAFQLWNQLASEPERTRWQLDVLARAAEAGQREWTAKHLAVLYQRHRQAAARPRPFDDVIFALLYAFVGERETSQEIWKEIEASPGFKPEEAVTFYLGLIRFPIVRLRFSHDELRELIGKARQATLQLSLRDRAGVLLQVANVQHHQGLKRDLFDTLLLSDAAARQRLAATGDVNDSNDLLKVASWWRKQGQQEKTRAALDFVRKNVTKNLRSSVAFHMAGAGFWLESLQLLQSRMPDNDDFYNGFAQMQTRQNGGDPLLWIQKLKSATHRAAALSGAAEGCEPADDEERELVLSGGRMRSTR